MTSDKHQSRISHALLDPLLNLSWFGVTAIGLLAVDSVWQFQSWAWGLLFGSGVGAIAVMVIVVAAKEIGLEGFDG